jgi:hypothetical protein
MRADISKTLNDILIKYDIHDTEIITDECTSTKSNVNNTNIDRSHKMINRLNKVKDKSEFINYVQSILKNNIRASIMLKAQ